MSGATEAITALLARYNDALNASSTDAVMPLYAEDGVFMPPYSPSAVGPEAVREAYDAMLMAPGRSRVTASHRHLGPSASRQ